MRKIKERTLSGTRNPNPAEYEQAHRLLARRAAAEGIVLLKNEKQILPLEKGSKIALFGAGAGRTIKGGTGSGDVNERDSVSIYDGLVNAGYQITNPKWVQVYEEMYTSARCAWRDEILNNVKNGSMPFFDVYSTTPFYLPTGPKAESSEADTAIYVISRIAGEGSDRFNQEGDYLLTEEERVMLKDICTDYKKVIIAVNTGGLIDLSFLDEYSNIYAVLQIVQPGMEGGNAFADIISGASVPSGKLADSWAYRYEDYPSAATFSHNNGNVNEEYYEEGIYVGYRYFDSFDVPVRYSFGYGMSYTDFMVETLDVCVREEEHEKQESVMPEVIITAKVTNTGAVYSGKEVVQVYVSAPEGKLEKEYRRLCGFAKTKELAPGESQEVEISFAVDQMASYDEEEGEWILEPGYYGIWVGTSLNQSELKARLSLKQEKVLTKVDHICPLQAELNELKFAEAKRGSRYNEWVEAGERQGLPVIALDLTGVTTQVIDYSDVPENEEDEAVQLVKQLDVEQFIQLATGDPGKGQGSNLGSAGISVPGSAGETSSCAASEGIASIVLADGPAGLRLNQSYHVKDGKIVAPPFEASLEHGFFCPDLKQEGDVYYQHCTAIPVGTLLAQTWDVELIEEIGRMIGDEMQRFGVDLWLAPGMNIHRNPLCGRNFEYYSEDPLISGKIATAMTLGVQSVAGCGTTIKHFACNNQEDNRMGSNGIISERALREIYLKGFEIAVKESHPMSIMTSYNLINGVHAANNYDICTKAARKEWGFDGVIMTDWTTTEQGPDCTAAGCMRAGNDLVMPGQFSDHENIRKELAEGTLTEKELRDCIVRLVRVILRSGQYELPAHP